MVEKSLMFKNSEINLDLLWVIMDNYNYFNIFYDGIILYKLYYIYYEYLVYCMLFR